MTPTSASSSRRWSARCASAGTTIDLAVLDRRGGGKRRYARRSRDASARAREAGRRLRALPRPVRPARVAGRRAARRHRARPRRAQRRLRSRGSPRLTRRVVRARVRRDRRVGLPAPRARGEGAGRARQDGGRRLRRRPRALLAEPSRHSAGWSRRRSSASGRLTERKNVVRLADAFARLGEGSLTFVGDGPLRAQLEGRERVRVVGRVPHDEVPGVDRRARTSSASRA